MDISTGNTFKVTTVRVPNAVQAWLDARKMSLSELVRAGPSAIQTNAELLEENTRMKLGLQKRDSAMGDLLQKHLNLEKTLDRLKKTLRTQSGYDSSTDHGANDQLHPPSGH